MAKKFEGTSNPKPPMDVAEAKKKAFAYLGHDDFRNVVMAKHLKDLEEFLSHIKFDE